MEKCESGACHRQRAIAVASLRALASNGGGTVMAKTAGPCPRDEGPEAMAVARAHRVACSDQVRSTVH